MIERLRRTVTARPALVGVVGAVLILVGGSWYQALITPPYRFVDEQAHAGYVLAVQSGELPSIDTPIDGEHGGVALRTRLAEEPARRQDVWVANNPPLTYVLAAGPAAITRALGLPGGPLLGLRLVNIAAVAGAVALAYLLGRDLGGGDRSVGLVTAGLVAASPHLGFVASLGFNDGVSLLATTGVLLALARVAGAGERAWGDRRCVQELGIWCALASATRPMAMVVAVGAAALGFAITWWRRTNPRLWTLAWLGLPTLVTSGWFYALNVHRYGDPTGSSALFDKFGRQATSSLWGSLSLKGLWESVFRTITTRRLEAPLPGDPYAWYRVTLAVALAGVLGTVILVTVAGVANRGRAPRRTGRFTAPLPVAAWLAVAAVSVIPVLLTAQHRAGGGAPHARYLLPVLPVLAAAVALALVRVATRWAGIVLVLVLAAATWRQTRASAQWLADNLTGPPGSQLVTAYGNELVRGAGLVAAGLGLVLLVAAVAYRGSEPSGASRT